MQKRKWNKGKEKIKNSESRMPKKENEKFSHFNFNLFFMLSAFMFFFISKVNFFYDFDLIEDTNKN